MYWIPKWAEKKRQLFCEVTARKEVGTTRRSEIWLPLPTKISWVPWKNRQQKACKVHQGVFVWLLGSVLIFVGENESLIFVDGDGWTFDLCFAFGYIDSNKKQWFLQCVVRKSSNLWCHGQKLIRESSKRSNSWTWGEMHPVSRHFSHHKMSKNQLLLPCFSWICSFLRCFFNGLYHGIHHHFKPPCRRRCLTNNFPSAWPKSKKIQVFWGHLPPEQIYQRCGKGCLDGL